MDDTFTRSDLLAAGLTDRHVRAAIDEGRLVRLRRGHFGRPGSDTSTALAIRVGGRLACVSELRRRGVWVLDTQAVHVQVDPHASRLRHEPGVRLHWNAPHRPVAASHVGIVDALVCAYGCLDRRAWIASVDSALHTGQLADPEVAMLRAALPVTGQRLFDLRDARAESGLESIVRILARDLGLRVRSQVRVPGVGRVDLIVEDWIAVETDGTAFHDVAMSPRDRRRDARLAATGRTALRPGYSLIVHDMPAVARQLIGAVESHRRVKNSGELAKRARARARRIGIS